MDDLEIKIGGDANEAVGALSNARGAVQSLADGIVGDLAKIAVGWVSVKAAVEGAIAGMRNADELRDLGNSLTVISGSAKNAAEALEFFEKAQHQSRQTGDELATMYRDLLPQAISRGFSQESMRPITLWLSQIATESGKTVSEIQGGFQALLGGRADGRNPLLQALGFTKADVDSLGWDQLTAKMAEMSSHFPEFGQSFESTMNKVKDSLLDAFSNGFNDAQKDAALGMAGILDIVNSPEVQSTLHDLGKGFAEIGPDVVRGLMGAGGALKMFFGGVETTVGLTIAGIAGAFGKTWEMIARFGNDIPGWQKSLIKLATGVDIGEASSAVGSAATNALGLASYGLGLAEKGAEGVRSGLEMITTDPFANVTAGAQKAGEATSGLTREISELVRGLGRVKVDGKDAAKVLEEMTLPSRGGQDLLNGIGVAGWQIAPGGRPVFSQNMDMTYLPESDSARAEHERKAAQAFADEASKRFSEKLQVDAVSTLGDSFGALFRKGADGFMNQLTRQFDQMAAAGGKSFVEAIFGAPTKQNADGTWGPNHDKTQRVIGGLVDAEKHPQAAGYAQEGLDFASIGIGTYAAGRQAPSNAVGMGAIQGALAGATYSWAGAIVGAIIGAIGGAMGAAKARSEYQYGVPIISDSGTASLLQPKNLTRDAILQMTGDVQGTFDTYRNQYTRLAMSLGVDSPSRWGITGNFQPEASAHWGEHFQQWMSQTLPREIAGMFKSELREGFGNVGLSGGQFDAMWQKYQGLDPAKVAPMLQGLAEALKGFQDTGAFFGKSSSLRLGDAQGKMAQSFAESLGEGDAKILEFASHLDDLVGEDQINAARELAQMQRDRQSAEEQFVKTLVSTLKAAHDAADTLRQGLDVRLMHKADGTPDYEALGQYYKSDADKQLAAISGAKTPEAAQRAWEKFLGDLDKVSQLGFNISTKTGDDWTKWAQQQIDAGQVVFDKVMAQMGDAMAAADKAFLAALNPSIEAFKGSLGGANVHIGAFGDATAAAAGSLISLQSSASNLAEVFDILAARASSSDFAARTVASR